MIAQEINWPRRAAAGWEAGESASVRAAGGARFLSLLGDAFGSELPLPLAETEPAEAPAPASVAADSRPSGVVATPSGRAHGVVADQHKADQHGTMSSPATAQHSRPASTNRGDYLPEGPAQHYRSDEPLSKRTADLLGDVVGRAWNASNEASYVERGSRVLGEFAADSEMNPQARSASSIVAMPEDGQGASRQSAVIFATLLHVQGEAGAEKSTSAEGVPLLARAATGGRLAARSVADAGVEANSSHAEVASVESGLVDLSALSRDELLNGLIQRLRAGAVTVARVGDAWQFRGPIPGLGAVDIRVAKDPQGGLNGTVHVSDPATLGLALSMTRAADTSPLRSAGERIRWKVVGPNARQTSLAAHVVLSSRVHSEEP